MHAHETTTVQGAAATLPPAWGVHLLLDIAACRLDAATDERVIREFVSDLVEAIEMRAHGEPLVAHFAEHTPEAAGWSIVQLIETSNITGHFCDLSGDAYLDVFSCKSFDTARAIALVEERFSPHTIKATLVQRQA
jgi:S-adenosylmethionine decarboxylase